MPTARPNPRHEMLTAELYMPPPAKLLSLGAAADFAGQINAANPHVSTPKPENRADSLVQKVPLDKAQMLSCAPHYHG